MSNAHKGRRNEHKARAWLEDMGYVVTRSAGSKGAWDLIGARPENFVLVQCKTNEWPSPDERRALQDFAAPKGTRRLMVRFDDRKPLAVREWFGGEWVPIQ